ncbi:MAG: hypothetical protein HWN67_03980 [Candidatus Helarchaeota archaeon]|nr:hypothetical protein [Candidatus Helarchaeota archaeon]
MIIYLQDTPSWKCSYRLISGMFEDDSEFYLQNYALVDNILDEDWLNVDLTLVSGLPISFVYDLYSPNWITRSFKKPEKEYGLTAVEFEESEAEVGLLPETEEMPAGEVERRPSRPKKGKKLGFAAGPGGPPAPPPPPMAAPSPVARPSAKRKEKMRAMKMEMAMPVEEEAFDEIMADEEPKLSVADATSVFGGGPTSNLAFSSGTSADSSSKTISDFKVSEEAKSSEELAFRYVVPVPVTVKRNQSALIPILQKKIKGEKVSVYNEKVREINPMLSVNIKNTSGYSLESGPISFYGFEPETSEAIFEGEALLPFLRPTEERRVPYSVDLQLRVLKKIEDIQKDTRQFIFKNGSFYKMVYSIKKFVYKIINSSKLDKALIIEQPKVSGFYLYDTEEPIEKTANYLRFRVEIKAREVKEFVITFRRLNKISTGLDSISPNLVNRLHSQGLIVSTDLTYNITMKPDALKLKCCEVKEKKIDDVQQNVIENKYESEIDGKKISLFNYTYTRNYPLKCVEVINSLDKIIESGPITIYQDEKFLSVGMLPILEKKEKTIIPYSIDTNCEIILNTETRTEDTGLIYYLWGLFRLKELIYIYEYSLENNGEESKVIVLEHPKIQYDLFDSPNPSEEFQDFYRFLIEIGPKEKKEFVLKFKGPIRDPFSFTPFAQEGMDRFSNMKLINDSELSYKLIQEQEGFNLECYKMNDANIQKYLDDPRVDLVPGRQSKIENIFKERVNCQLYLVFNLERESEYPILNFEIENTLDRTILCGPVTVWDKKNYIGESILPTIKENDKYRIPVNHDTNVYVIHRKSEKTQKEPHEIVFKRSGIYEKYYIIQTNVYTMTNNNDFSRDIVIEHAKEKNYEIVPGDYDYREKFKFWSFKTRIAESTLNKEYVFKLRTKTESRIIYTDITRILMEHWIEKNLLNNEQNDFLLELVGLLENKKDLLKNISELQGEYDDIVEDQKRLRANLKSLHSSEQSSRARYTGKLEVQEVKIEELYQKIKELTSKIEPLDKQIEELILGKAPITEDDVIPEEVSPEGDSEK